MCPGLAHTRRRLVFTRLRGVHAPKDATVAEVVISSLHEAAPVPLLAPDALVFSASSRLLGMSLPTPPQVGVACSCRRTLRSHPSVSSGEFTFLTTPIVWTLCVRSGRGLAHGLRSARSGILACGCLVVSCHCFIWLHLHCCAQQNVVKDTYLFGTPIDARCAASCETRAVRAPMVCKFPETGFPGIFKDKVLFKPEHECWRWRWLDCFFLVEQGAQATPQSLHSQRTNCTGCNAGLSSTHLEVKRNLRAKYINFDLRSRAALFHSLRIEEPPPK